MVKELDKMRHDTAGSSSAEVVKKELAECRAALKKATEEASELRTKLSLAEAKIRDQQESIRAKEARCSKAEQSLAQLRAKWQSLHVVFSSEPHVTEEDTKK